ncbi:hypothetical protein SAMN05216184_101316 [Georgenia satyanarayanai]|uniref:site-specific DNA-methyltransferase (adenine-specific) n=1 Tax=Georgenia satyanarayanai TaxID=860221 RepID=A0A2Y8ZX63_9MICO|nr:DNA methyltransferase [Georgenia satyanarayanai]PYG01851.1 hypothetical protein A8987_101316 [Georgenia satyanarayanai]SSA36654.1 hypothetical protein SAMN05216184_101316 [Georgenia satyanarayanai]
MSPRPGYRPRRPDDVFAWLDLVVVDGPFLARPAVKAQYRDGLPRPDATVDQVGESFTEGFRLWERAWTTWVRSARDDSATAAYLTERDAWVTTMTRQVLEWDGYIVEASPDLQAVSLDGERSVRPTAVLRTAEEDEALLLVVDPTDDLAAPGADGWTATAIDRGAALLRASRSSGLSGIPVALVTDGRWWALVWISDQGAVGSGTFDGALFREEPDLRAAFWALARLTSVAGGAPERRLPALLRDSVASTEEITDQLGQQVRAAVELLVQSFSESHLHALAAGETSPLPEDGHVAYDAAVTVMMRVVFLLFAEANELLPDSVLYRDAYAISDVGERLDARRRAAVAADGEELLEGAFDTWHRLLATSSALYEGATFEDLRMPAYGGSLFDPERFAWLLATDPTTGRLRVVVDDRVMLHVLRAVQQVRIGNEARAVSFRDLDVEQIGYVYEGLLGYSARFTEPDETIIGLSGPQDGAEPEIPLEVLHQLSDDAGEDPAAFAAALVAWLKEDQPGARAGTVRQIAKAYETSGTVEAQDEGRRVLRPVVRDTGLLDELVGYIHLIRRDLRGLPYVVLGGGLVVVETRSRANSGTHYTPRALAEEVVLHALEPLVYQPGPLQTADTSEWKLIPSSQILDLKVADIAVGSGAFLVAAARYLGGKLLEAWDAEGITREDVSAEQRRRREIEARREIVAHCLYGADINPMAVEMCKLSLWLVSLDRDKPFSFVDDKIFRGNSLLGLTELRQLRGLHIDPSPARLRNPGFTVDVDLAIQRATEIRGQLATAVSDGDAMRTTHAKRQLMRQLDQQLEELRTVADGIVAAGLAVGGKPGKLTDATYENLSLALMRASLGDDAALTGIIERGLTPMVPTDYNKWRPLHWILEVPDVMFGHGGFDAVVGNPPFLGGKKLTGAMGDNVRDWFVHQIAGGTRGSADLVAYFFLRGFGLLHPERGQLGLIATNTIAQGDTREVGLDRLAEGGLTLRRAIQSAPWPARSANLEYAGVWGSRAPLDAAAERVSDGNPVRAVSTLLEPQGRAEGAPVRLAENAGIAFVGSYVLGKGFVLTGEEATAMFAADPRNRDVVFPYLNGEDLNSRPDMAASRWVINFFDWSEERAATYKAPYAWIRDRVMPERTRRNPDGSFVLRKPLPERWWIYADKRPRLYREIATLSEILVIARVGKVVMPARVPTGQVCSDATVVFATDDFGIQAVLSSSFHQIWAIAYGSTLGTVARYTPSDVFESFPRPVSTSALEESGRVLDGEVRSLMKRRGLGFTKLYNRVNDPEVVGDPDVRHLRDIHVALDEAVLDAYGWHDVQLRHGFHSYRQAQRFTIDPAARVEILDRLLEENQQRAGGSGQSEIAGALSGSMRARARA